MNKTKYPSLTNYLAKTKKNADLYRLYNPQFSFFLQKWHSGAKILFRLFLKTYGLEEKYFNRILYLYIHLL